MNEFLDLERHGDVAVLTMRRHDKRNAMHEPLWTGLRDAARSLADDAPRVVVVTGSGGHFSAGMDLSRQNTLFERLAPAVAGRDEAALRAIIEDLKATMSAFAELPCPTVAAIEGACCGSGLELALSCDLRVATRAAFFSLPETLVGLAPDVGGIVRLTRLVGRARATDLALTGRRITAEKAYRWGLLDRLAEGAAIDAAMQLADDLLGASPAAARHTLAVIRAVDELDDAAAFEAETLAGIETLKAGDFREGIAAFVEKRPPRWRPA